MKYVFFFSLLYKHFKKPCSFRIYLDDVMVDEVVLDKDINPIKDFKEYMLETNLFISMNGYFENEDNFEIIENQNDFLSNYNPLWIGINNKLYREFFYMTLGKFSGYSLVESELL